MANHTQQLLNTWYKQRKNMDWVLATIIGTEGSSYRKPGAMMMINSLGQYHGLLSGGCLESDIMRQSRQCWADSNNRIVQYDMREEEDIAWQLGIGCGGLVRILLQPINAINDYLQLVKLRKYINQNQACKYTQYLNEGLPINKLELLLKGNDDRISADHPSSTERLSDNKKYFEHIIKPSLKLAIFGGGIDAIPVVNIAVNLGWHVIVADPRIGYARKSQFAEAKQIVKAPLADASEHHWLSNIDAIVIMTHNLKLDAQALVLAQSSTAKYVGMLGPIHRTDRVLIEAGFVRSELNQPVKENNSQGQKALVKPLANPIGLRLGGELPESIALSMLAEIHAFMEQCDGKSISKIVG